MKMRLLGQAALWIIVLGTFWPRPAQAQTYSVLFNFGTSNGDPYYPPAPGTIAQGRDGNLYTTTEFGGVEGVGAAFRVTTTGKLSLLHSFNETHGGENPSSGLTLGTDGSLYGTTQSGGPSQGVIFKLTPSGKYAILYRFSGYPPDGGLPEAAPIEGTDGNFYGTAYQGGEQTFGSVYKLTRSGKFSTLYSFDSTTGVDLNTPLVQGRDGNLYGTTSQGGTRGYGTVFKITPTGKLTVLYNFDFTHGNQSTAPLIQASDGIFYGTTTGGGTTNFGVIFSITSKGVLNVLHNFSGSDGIMPRGGLVQASDGKLYGTSAEGGTQGCGTIFVMDLEGTFSKLYDFDYTTGCGPQVSLLQHTNGVLYGDTDDGGSGSEGVFYSFDVDLRPFVRLLPASSKIGETIGILGQGFKGTTRVAFNGTDASFTVVSGTYLTTTVPNGATTGFVTVTTPKGKLKSDKKFRVQ
jgi:uncharacterized repeat protein (TIGR03803 family)